MATRKPLAAITGTVDIRAAFAATTRKPAFSVTGKVNFTGTITGAPRKPSSNITGGVTTGGIITAVTRKPTSNITGNVAVRGNITANTRKPTLALTGKVNFAGTITATTRKPTAFIIGVNIAVKGPLAVTTRKPTASFTSSSTGFAAVLAARTRKPASVITAKETLAGSIATTTRKPRALVTGTLLPRGSIAAATRKPNAVVSGTVANTVSSDNATTAWTAHTDPLLVMIDQSISGQNFKDNRTIWHGLSDITFSTGGIANAVWYKDFGPLANPENVLEPRAFCLKGQADFTFTGTTLIIRVNVAYSWFTGAILTIDGAHQTTLSCDAATYQLTGDGYVDVPVADNLTNGSHTCKIVINSSDASKFFSISGYKVGTLTSQPIKRTGGWLVPKSALLAQNLTTLTIKNTSPTKSVANVSFTFPSTVYNQYGSSPTSLTVGSLSPGATLTTTILPGFTGDEISGDYTYNFRLTGQYVDPAGTITATTTITALVGNPTLAFTGTWFSDAATDTGQTRNFTNIASAYFQFTFTGNSLTMTIQTAFGWGQFGIYASDNTTLLGIVDCNDNVQLVVNKTVTGFGTGSHSVYVRKTTNDSKYVVFVGASWSATNNYTQIGETISLTYSAQQPVPMTVQNVAIGNFDATFDQPIQDERDYSGTPVRINQNLAYTEVMTRFPTFCVFYQSGNRDLLAQYDILIIDPLAAHAADVIYWQSKGIKVYGYISSGEETGFYQNRYDFSSALAPNSGAGPGGYASYYMYTKHPVSGPPDTDGVWAAYYVNPDPTAGWTARLESYYAPQVLGGPVTYTAEVVTTKTVSTTGGSRIVFDTANSPIDADQPITLTTFNGATTYVTYRDFTFDVKTGAFVLATNISPAVVSGAQLKITYTRKGHHCDGVFFDTVDTPDVYGSAAFGYSYVAGYATNFANMINTFKANHPSAEIISNRGFTILPQIIQSCKGVMFETWLTYPDDINNLATTNYHRVTDLETVSANELVHTQLSTLRKTYTFDVYSLNYTSESDLTLRDYCREQDAEHGYMSWQTTILLNAPASNSTSAIPGQPLQTVFERYKITPTSPTIAHLWTDAAPPDLTSFMQINAMASNASLIVGVNSDNGADPIGVKWTSSNVYGTVPNTSVISATTADGHFIAGNYQATVGSNIVPFVYNTITGAMSTYSLPTACVSCTITGISADGNYIVGTSLKAGALLATVWHAGTPTVLTLLGGGGDSEAYALSADGTKAVGSVAVSGTKHPVAWTISNNTVTDIGKSATSDAAVATAVSADGNIIAGWCFYATDPNVTYRAFRWTPGTGTVELTPTAALYDTAAAGISADGSVIVGYSSDSGGRHAAKWVDTTTAPTLYASNVSSDSEFYGCDPTGNYGFGYENFKAAWIHL